MKLKTNKLFAAMTVAMAKKYGIDSVAEQFTAAPSIEQKLVDKIVESDDFLQTINMMPVDDKSGPSLSLKYSREGSIFFINTGVWGSIRILN